MLWFNAEGYPVPMLQVQVQQDTQGLPFTFSIAIESTPAVNDCQQARTEGRDQVAQTFVSQSVSSVHLTVLLTVDTINNLIGELINRSI